MQKIPHTQLRKQTKVTDILEQAADGLEELPIGAHMTKLGDLDVRAHDGETIL